MKLEARNIFLRMIFLSQRIFLRMTFCHGAFGCREIFSEEVKLGTSCGKVQAFFAIRRISLHTVYFSLTVVGSLTLFPNVVQLFSSFC